MVDLETDYLVINTDIGLVPLTDPKQIAIYNLLKKSHMMNYNSIASSLNVPSSTLKYILLKLQDTHVISKEPGDRGKYYPRGIPLLHQSPEDHDPATLDYSMRKLVNREFNYFAFSDYISLYAKYMGIDLKVTWKIYADYICSYTRKLIPKGNIDEVIQPIIDLFKRLCVGFNIVLFRSKPLIIVFYGPCDNAPFIKACIELFQMWLESATCMTYNMEYDYTRCDKLHITIKFVNNNVAMMPLIPDRLHTGVVNKFILLSSGNRSYIIDNPVQIEILHQLSETPKTITELVNGSKLPRSTITMNVRKLTEMNFLKAVHNSRNIAYYTYGCHILMNGNGIECDCGGISSSIENSINVSGFTGGFGQFFIQYMRCMGVNCDKMMFDMGSNVAVQKNMMGWDFNDFYAVLTDTASQMGVGISLRNMKPLIFNLEFSTTYMKKPFQFFFMGIINKAFEMMTYRQHICCISEKDDVLSEITVIPNQTEFIDYDPLMKERKQSVKVNMKQKMMCHADAHNRLPFE